MMQHAAQLGVLALAGIAAAWMLRRRIRGGAACFFLWVALAATYPLAFSPTKLMLDSGGSTDAYIFLWNFWWVYKALVELHVSPFFTDYVYYPHGTTLTLHSLALPYALASVPFQWIWEGETGLCVATNTAIVFSFWLAGHATYLLAFRLVEDRGAAIAAGLAYTLCNFHFANTVRLHALSIEWIPVFALCALRQGTTGRMRDGLWTGLALACAFYSSQEYAYVLALWFVVRLIVQLLVGRAAFVQRSLRGAAGMFAAAMVFGVLTLPFWRAYARERGWHHPVLTAAEVGETSADLIDGILPNARHPIYGDRLRAYLRSIHQGDDGMGLGHSYAVLLLAMAGVAVALRQRDTGVYSWIAGVVFFSVMALGTTMRVCGQDTGIGLPFAWLRERLPLLDQLQMPIRFTVIVYVSLAVLSAYGLKWLRVQLGGPRGTGVTLAAIVLILFETLSLPMSMHAVRMPSAYRELAGDGAAGTLIDWPAGRGRSLMCEVFHQTGHGRRLVQDVAAFLPRVSAEAQAASVSPAFRRLEASILGRDLLDSADLAERARLVRQNQATIERLEVRYIVLRKADMDPEWLAAAGENILLHLPARVSDYGDALVFELPFSYEDSDMSLDPRQGK